MDQFFMILPKYQSFENLSSVWNMNLGNLECFLDNGGPRSQSSMFFELYNHSPYTSFSLQFLFSKFLTYGLSTPLLEDDSWYTLQTYTLVTPHMENKIRYTFGT